MQHSKKSMMQRIAVAVLAATLGSAALATDASARGGGGGHARGGGGHFGGGGGHFGGLGGAHFGGMGAAHLGASHFGGGHMVRGLERGHFRHGRFGYFGDDSCWPLDTRHPWRNDYCS